MNDIVQKLRSGLDNSDGGELGGVVLTMQQAADRIEALEGALRMADEFLTVLQTPGSEPLNSINGGDKAAWSHWTAELRNQARVVWATVGNTLNTSLPKDQE